MELALQSVIPDALEPPLALPYWDQTSKKCREEGIPKLLTDREIEIRGKFYRTPLFSYTFQCETDDEIDKEDNMAYKPKGYVTTRYPFSGIQTTELGDSAEKHNR